MTEPADSFPLVGRDTELASVERLLEDNPAEQGFRLVTVTGEPGIGKSRLLTGVLARATARGWTSLYGAASAAAGGVPFGVVVDALDHHLDGLGAALAEPPVDGALAAVFPALAPVFPALTSVFPALASAFPALVDALPATDRRLTREAGYRTCRALGALLELLATSSAGLVVALDDVHLADDASLLLLGELVRHPPRAPVVLLVAYRPAQAPAGLTAALSVPAAQAPLVRVPLGPLTRTDVGDALGPAADRLLGDELYGRSGGNPLYLLAFAPYAYRPDGATAMLAGADTLPARELPEPVRSTVLTDLAKLGRRSALVARAAAVAGDPFDPALVVEVAGVPRPVVLDALDALAGADLVRPVHLSSEFHFRHPVVRHAIYLSAEPGWRLAAHGRAAAALSGAGAPATVRAPHLAHVARRGDEHALGVLVEAGRAEAGRAPAVAAQWFRAALHLLPEAAARADVVADLAGALAAGGELRQSHEHLQGVRDERATATRLWVERLLGLRVGAPPADLVGPDAPAFLRLELAVDAHQRGWDRSLTTAERALDRANDERDELLRALAAAVHAVTALARGDLRSAAGSLRLAIELTRQIRADILAGRPELFAWLAGAELMRGHLDRSLRYAERGLALARATGQVSRLPELLTARSGALARRGRLAEALEDTDSILRIARQIDSRPYRAIGLSLRSQQLSLLGDHEHAVPAARSALTAAEPVNGRTLALAALSQIVVGTRLGQPQVAPQLVDRCGGPELPAVGFADALVGYNHLAWSEAMVGRTDRAGQWAARAEEAVGRDGAGRWCSGGYAALARARVLLDRHPSDAANHAERAAETMASVGCVVEAGEARLLLATAAARAGQPARAAAAVRHAESLLSSTGEPALLAVTARRWRDGLPSAPARPSAEPGPAHRSTGRPYGLTARELEVARLVADGHTNREIAEQLFIGERTVETHLARVFGKLRVKRRAAVAGALVRQDNPAIAVP